MEPTTSIRPTLLHRWLMRLDPERAHEIAIAALRCAGWSGFGRGLLRWKFAGREALRLEQEILGRVFPNPVGLAAGFDKNAVAIRGLGALGFGFVEVGTVTPRPQAGNPRPRIFRHPREESLQNALGFNNDGMEAIHRRVTGGYPYPFPVGVNVGKNATTPLDRAEDDYETLFRGFAGGADYYVVNISSPNTPGLRDLQSPERVAGLVGLGRDLTARPVLVKLSPDLDLDAAVELAGAAVEAGAAGVIVANTTTDYRLIPGARDSGGLSGRVLQRRSFEMLEALAGALFGRTVLVSVGGVGSGDEVYRRLRAGASLVQIYTAFVYQGPALVRRVLARLAELMERDGLDTIDQVIGYDAGR